MEMTLGCKPAMTTNGREVQANSITWSAMKSLVQSGIKRDCKSRLTMSQILHSLQLL